MRPFRSLLAALFLAGLVATGAAPPTVAAPTSPVELHGHLYVCGTKICDRHNRPVTLRGVSMFWSNWAPESYRRATVSSLRNDWEADVVRIAVAADNYGGPLGSSLATDYEGQLRLAKSAIDWAREQGVYIIVDFHSHRKQTALATRFFGDLAATYGNLANLIFEPWNEPCYTPGDCRYTWSRDIKPHHDSVIRAVHAQRSWPIFIAGTRDWDQHPAEVASDRLPYGKVVYALHFYAGTGGADHEYLKGELRSALAAKVPVFVSEFGCTNNLGQSGWDWPRCSSWLSLLNDNGVGHAVWAVAKPSQTGQSGLLTDATSYDDGVQLAEVTDRGRQYRTYLKDRGGQ